MRFILNKEDNVSLMRIINTPPRGIGASAISKIESEAKKYMISTFEAIKRIIKEDTVSATLKRKACIFCNIDR